MWRDQVCQKDPIKIVKNLAGLCQTHTAGFNHENIFWDIWPHPQPATGFPAQQDLFYSTHIWEYRPGKVTATITALAHTFEFLGNLTCMFLDCFLQHSTQREHLNTPQSSKPGLEPGAACYKVSLRSNKPPPQVLCTNKNHIFMYSVKPLPVITWKTLQHNASKYVCCNAACIYFV